MLYRDILRGRQVMDVGSGLGMDALIFAEHGARVTCVDVVESNLKLIERLARLLKVPNLDFVFFDRMDSLAMLTKTYDVIWCLGSMINVPFTFACKEARELLLHLPIGGRWIELAYPKERWEREGNLPFNEWGVRTDGPGTPWVEWYDLEKLTRRLASAQFDVVLHFNFHDDDFNWFDLVRRA